MLDYYDIVFETCGISKSLEGALGYKKVFIVGKDVRVIEGKGSGIKGGIFIDTGKANVLGIMNESPSAIVFRDMRINKKAMEQMNDKGIALCIPMDTITSSYGLQRSRTLYMTSKLLKHAMDIRLNVSFVTLARSELQLCSYMQLIELAKLLGANEEQARMGTSETNKSLVAK
ncbi:MAG: hypothetical protein ACREBH_03765 [Candidatus Micrarchaeaceae archaeon]